ncbi:MAG: hypothetical protein FGF51_07185 [Candidatus Brockarchaeota archaeon]|nr:hypothetical protein [Candidatus Brockarchaeota archaeon]
MEFVHRITMGYAFLFLIILVHATTENDERISPTGIIYPIRNYPSFYPVISEPPQHVEIHDTYNSTALWDGKCWLSQTSGNIIEHAIIYLNTYYVDSYSYNKKKSLACHELGHVLGLYDVGPYNPVIMNGYILITDTMFTEFPLHNKTT